MIFESDPEMLAEMQGKRLGPNVITWNAAITANETPQEQDCSCSTEYDNVNTHLKYI